MQIVLDEKAAPSGSHLAKISGSERTRNFLKLAFCNKNEKKIVDKRQRIIIIRIFN